MEHSESIHASSVDLSLSDRLQGLSTILKVIGLAAGYAVFVWYTMYQVEHGFSALTPFSKGTEVGVRSSEAAIAGTGQVTHVTVAGAPSAMPQPATELVSARPGGV